MRHLPNANNIPLAITMASYTPVDVREMIDKLDDTLRAAILQGNIQETFDKERKNVVSNFTM